METKQAPKPGDVRTRPIGGAELLSSRHFPEAMQGNLLALNTIGFRGILNYKVSEDGAGLRITEVEPILSSADENFRPVDAEVGPDGALYFTDWHNPIIGHMQHNLRDTSRDKLHGRVYRVTAVGRPLLKHAVISGAPIPALLDLLKEPENRVRYRARIELSGRPTGEVIAATTRWLESQNQSDPQYEHHALEALILEPLFNLPVFQPGLRDNWFANSFFNSHPIHQAGILTDASCRPLDQKGEQILDNVWIAGSILAGHNCIQEKSREGIEIATGYWAAKSAMGR